MKINGNFFFFDILNMPLKYYQIDLAHLFQSITWNTIMLLPMINICLLFNYLCITFYKLNNNYFFTLCKKIKIDNKIIVYGLQT